MWVDSNIKMIEILYTDMQNDKHRFPQLCPYCNKEDCHLFYHRHTEGSPRGGAWVWCSSCHNCAHVSFRIPDWWENLENIDFKMLSSDFSYLEKNKQRIDNWINELVNKTNEVT